MPEVRLSSVYLMSLSSRRAWIEMALLIYRFIASISRSPHGERGLKFMFLVRTKNV